MPSNWSLLWVPMSSCPGTFWGIVKYLSGLSSWKEVGEFTTSLLINDFFSRRVLAPLNFENLSCKFLSMSHTEVSKRPRAESSWQSLSKVCQSCAKLVTIVMAAVKGGLRAREAKHRDVRYSLFLLPQEPLVLDIKSHSEPLRWWFP